MKNEIKRTCFSCEKDIHPCDTGKKEDDFRNPPDNATYWRSTGNYGSTVYDGGEFNDERLEMYICDECLKKKAKHVYHFRAIQKEDIDLKTFDKYLDPSANTEV